MAVTPKQKQAVKVQGFLNNRGTEKFSARILTGNGTMTAEQLAVVSQAAKEFGSGTVSFTSRLTVEVPGIPFDRIQEFQDYLAPAGLVTGGTGAKVRPVVACKGTVCVFGLINTQGLAQEIHERFFVGYGGVALPHKFKIAVGGCPNSCVKPDLNDIGIVGARTPRYLADRCKECKVCAVANQCPMKAAVKGEDGPMTIDKEICNDCGRCIEKCPFSAVPDGEVGYKIFLGGRWGKVRRMGTPLGVILTREEALDMVEKAILLYKKEGQKGERFGSMIDRLGIDAVRAVLLTGDLLAQKEEILRAE